METKPKTIIISITQEQHEYLLRLVKDSGRTISELVRYMIQERVDFTKRS